MGHRLGEDPLAQVRAPGGGGDQVHGGAEQVAQASFERTDLHRTQWRAQAEQQVDVRPFRLGARGHRAEHPDIAAAGLISPRTSRAFRRSRCASGPRPWNRSRRDTSGWPRPI